MIPLTAFLCAIDIVRARTNPNDFYSTFGGGTYYYQSDFSKRSSFIKFRDHLQLIGAAWNNDPTVIILNNADIPIRYYDLEYKLFAYEYTTERPRMGRFCHLRISEIKELSDIYIENLTQPLEHVYWTCPAYAWCCGAECCQHYYKNPWPVLGPDLYGLIAAAAIFIGILLILELFRRWQNKQASGEPVPIDASIDDIEQRERNRKCSLPVLAPKPVLNV